ncbi:unnamed protein product [Somion occarium]|uniref:Uncharacterized protein n=1 Tax=Somion occarium TaxID=3059160 RepID=A0ABP1DEZ2_9APHY
MRGYVGGRAWKDNFVEFNVFRLSRSLSHGIWLAITPSWDPHCLHGIWNKQRPLRRIENETTGAIVPHLEMLASTWLDPDCVAAVRISSTLYLPYHLRISDVDPDPFTIDLTALKLIIGHVEHVAQMHVSDWRERFTLANGTFFHLAWGQDEEMAAQKHTKNILDVGLRDRRHVAAIIRLMRTPGPFEGGSDYIFEKYMKVAVSLLYENGDIHFIEGTDCLTNDRLTSPLPLLIAGEYLSLHVPLLSTQDFFIGGSSDLSKKVQASFAAAARNTLVKLVRNHNEAGPSALALPEEFIVYGLHWSNARLHILAHFVTNIDSDDPDKWKFCQVLVAQHWITLEEVDHRNPIGSFRHYAEFDMLLDRWRVVVSLFMIRAHVQRLKQCLQTGDTAGYPSSEMGFVQSSEAYLGSSLPIDIGIAWRQPLHEYVCELHGFWRGSRIYVPAEWIPAEHEQLDLDIDDFEENVRPLMVSLAKLALSPLRPLLAPMDKETVVQNDQRMDYKGPRYTHSLQVPRSMFFWRRLNLDLKANTQPHLVLLYDLLMMATTSWDDINIFFANTFANFSTYAVRWDPCICYPFEVQTDDSIFIMDFALAVQTIPPTTPSMIKRAYYLPLSISSPAVLIGLRSNDMEGKGRVLSDSDLRAVRGIMLPHLRMVDLGFNNDKEKDTRDVGWPSWAILFCIIVKPGFVHIVGSTLSSMGDDHQVELHLVDSLPITMFAHDISDFEDRLRLATALFTLQTHVVRFAEQWASICWPDELLIEEHEAIVDVAEQDTPSPSEDAPPQPEQEWGVTRSIEDGDSRDSENTDKPRGENLSQVRETVEIWLKKLRLHQPLDIATTEV